MTKSAQCHCGGVQISVEGEPMRMAQCHCNSCQRMSGTGHATWAFFPTDQVTITGDLSTYESPTDSGAVKTRSFCPKCGSPLFTQGSKTTERIGIAASAFDDSSWFLPQMVVYPWDVPSWDVIDEALPKQEKPAYLSE